MTSKTLPSAQSQFLGTGCLPRPRPAFPGPTLQMYPQVVNAPPQEAPPGPTADLQQQMVLEDALNRF